MSWFRRPQRILSTHIGGNVTINNVTTQGDLVVINNGSASSKTIHASGEMGSKSFVVPPWTSIEVGHAFSVEVTIVGSPPPSPPTQGDPFRQEPPSTIPRVVLHGDKAFFEAVEARVTKGVLSFDWKESVALIGACVLRFEVESPPLESVETSGSSDVTISGICTPMEITTSGASCMTIKGAADKITVRSSGASRVRGRMLKVTRARVTSSGASEVTLDAGEIDARMSGASSLKVAHRTKVDAHVSGAASVHRFLG